MDMADATGLPYDEHRLVSCGVSGGALSLLVEQGLPADCSRMFVRDPDKELSVRELAVGRAVFLGSFEDGVNSYWLLIDSGEVWMVRGYEGDPDERYGLVNTSVKNLAEMLRIWESFVFSGRSDGADDYDDWAQEVIDRARQVDPMAFSNEDFWWSRVFEEVELGVLVPEET
ncbi:SUKH-4 family immunity protein [Streptomyces sp. NPDC006516]|uniref:SUKH-4 family immunity protein n=1 Tax=Streptomyces sp. NPDC006516 TaxID=3154309 RepID=UPI0033A7FA6E